jgi:hypothetical protein
MPYKRNVNSDQTAEWTPSGGSGGLAVGSNWPLPCFSLGGAGGNYAMIDDYPSIDDDTYNSTLDAGAIDRFGFQAFGFDTDWWDYSAFWSSDETYPALAIKLRARYDHPTAVIHAFITVDGNDVEADNPAPAGTFNGAFVEYTFYWLQNPVTLDYWLPEELNGTALVGKLEYVGYYKDGDGSYEAKVSRMYIESYPNAQILLVPDSDADIQWDRSGSSYNYQNLLTYDSHDNYNYTDVANEIDKFGFDVVDYNGDPYTIPANSDITWLYQMCQAIYVGEAGHDIKQGIWIDGTMHMQGLQLGQHLPDNWDDVLGGYGTNGWAVNPKTSNPWTVDDLTGVGSNAITHIGYQQLNTTDETQIAYLVGFVSVFPNDEPA